MINALYNGIKQITCNICGRKIIKYITCDDMYANLGDKECKFYDVTISHIGDQDEYKRTLEVCSDECLDKLKSAYKYAEGFSLESKVKECKAVKYNGYNPDIEFANIDYVYLKPCAKCGANASLIKNTLLTNVNFNSTYEVKCSNEKCNISTNDSIIFSDKNIISDIKEVIMFWNSMQYMKE